MKKSFAVILLITIFLVAFTSRVFISFQTPYFSYDSYNSLRQIEHIGETGTPIFNDDLSYSGRNHLFPPVFFYLVSMFDFMGSSNAAKIIPNLLFALIIIPIYLISFHITKKRSISLITSFFSAFMPIVFSSVNNISVYSLVLLLTLYVIYFIMKINSENHLHFAIIFLIAFVLTHSSVFILLFGLLLFLLLTRVESFESSSREQEIILFGVFLALWFNFVIFKNSFLMHGPLVIWQNIPLQILTNQFFDLSIIQSINFVGIMSVFFGVYALYSTFFHSKKRSLLLLIGLFLSVLLLLWFKLIAFRVGLLFIGTSLVLLSSHTIKSIYTYVKKTKAPYLANWFLVGVLLFFCLTAILPSINVASSSLKDVPSSSEVNALLWLSQNSDNDSVVLARPKEGFLVNYFANRKNVLDEDYLMAPNAQERYDDVSSVFSLRLKTEVVRRLVKYNVDYIYFSGKFGSEEKLYYVDDDCFDLVYDNKVKIYKLTCSIE